MERITCTAVVVFFLLILTPSALGASWSAYVLDTTGVGINSTNVTAVRSGTGIYLNSTLTNSSGFFNISIPIAPLRLVSSKTGYLNDTSQVLPPISDDRVLQFNITLIKNPPGNITGRVTSSGSGIENALVAAMQGGSIIDSALTNSSGDYAIVNLTDGTYTIKVDATGYVTQNITNVVVQPNSTTELNFTLALAPVEPSSTTTTTTTTTTGGGGGGGGGGSCAPGTELVEGNCVAIEEPKPVPEEEPEGSEAEEIPAEDVEEPIEEGEEPAQEIPPTQPPITGAAVAGPTQPLTLFRTGMALVILIFVLSLFVLNNKKFFIKN